MFDILMYLFENYIHSEAEIFVEQNELTDELLRAALIKAKYTKRLIGLSNLQIYNTVTKTPI